MRASEQLGALQRNAHRSEAQLETIGARLFSSLGLPDRQVLDVLGGVTLALVGGHLDDREAMARLHEVWQRWIGSALRRPAAQTGVPLGACLGYPSA